jgi:hypothetical protein
MLPFFVGSTEDGEPFNFRLGFRAFFFVVVFFAAVFLAAVFVSKFGHNKIRREKKNK